MKTAAIPRTSYFWILIRIQEAQTYTAPDLARNTDLSRENSLFNCFIFLCLAGWTDNNAQLSLKQRSGGGDPESGWGGGGSPYGGGAYTTGRRGRHHPPPLLPPGKLNMAEYNNVSAALGRLQVPAHHRGGTTLLCQKTKYQHMALCLCQPSEGGGMVGWARIVERLLL
jgi:hypothetical protein